MREYARRETAIRLARLKLEIARSVRARGADEIHDLRVSIRRLSRCLRAFSESYPGLWWKKARARLRELQHTAGAVRDRDIALELVAEAGVSGRAAVVTRLKAERAQAGRKLARALRRWRDRGFAERWRRQLGLRAAGRTRRQPREERLSAARTARRELPALVSSYARQVREELAKNPPPAALHVLRLATKRLRYTLELFRPCYGPGLDQRLEALRKVQQRLGDLNDCVAAWNLLSRTIRPRPLRTRVEKFLEERAQRHAREFRDEWRRLFQGPGKEEWWTRYLARPARPKR